MNLRQRLQEPEVLKEYDAVLKDQLNRGIIESSRKKMLVRWGRSTTFPIMQSSGETNKQQSKSTQCLRQNEWSFP